MVVRVLCLLGLLLLAHCSPRQADTKTMAQRLRCAPPRSDVALLHTVQTNTFPSQDESIQTPFFRSLKQQKEQFTRFLSSPPSSKVGRVKINLHSFTVLELFRT